MGVGEWVGEWLRIFLTSGKARPGAAVLWEHSKFPPHCCSKRCCLLCLRETRSILNNRWELSYSPAVQADNCCVPVAGFIRYPRDEVPSRVLVRHVRYSTSTFLDSCFCLQRQPILQSKIAFLCCCAVWFSFLFVRRRRASTYFVFCGWLTCEYTSTFAARVLMINDY